MCEKEKVHEIGATEEEMTERLEIYEHHRAAKAALVVATAAFAADAAAVSAVGADSAAGAAAEGPAYVAASFDVVAHFLAN